MVNSTISINFMLPRLNINQFNGNFNNWMSFKDLYISLLHNNVSITNIQKYQYLRGLLDEEQACIIKYISISESSDFEAYISPLIKTFI